RRQILIGRGWRTAGRGPGKVGGRLHREWQRCAAKVELCTPVLGIDSLMTGRKERVENPAQHPAQPLLRQDLRFEVALENQADSGGLMSPARVGDGPGDIWV